MRVSRQLRTGLGLTEVLIAIFTLALGLLGIMSLFPLAAVNMANAIKDENCAQVNQSCTAWWRVIWKEETPYPPNLYVDPYPAAPAPSPAALLYDPFFNAQVNPNFWYKPALAQAGGNNPYPTAVRACGGLSLPDFSLEGY